MTSLCSITFRPCCARPASSGRPARAQRRAVVPRAGNEAGDRSGVLGIFKDWPPKPITDHGKPKPEDDPQNYEGQPPFQTRVKGPPDSEIDERRQRERENSPFSKPDREGGTQAGGGGEGSAS